MLAGQPALVALAVAGDVLGVVLLELLDLLLCALTQQNVRPSAHGMMTLVHLMHKEANGYSLLKDVPASLHIGALEGDVYCGCTE